MASSVSYHCGSGDIITLLYHVILHYHVIKGPCDKFGGPVHSGSGDIIFLVCHMILT